MARRGRFGRMPRRAPDLTSSIVAMMREYWNLQENLMVNAWKEGGEVDGDVVNDQRLLDFWHERRDSVSRDDPLWDHYNNLHDQYDFAIRESEVGLKYAQKKMSAGEVARWYTGESKKYPRYSEIYRTIAGQAAKFLEAARAGAKQSNYEARAKAYTQASNANARENLWPHQIILSGLTEAFRYYGILGGSQTTTEGDEMAPELGQGEDLTDLSYMQGDPQLWGTVLDTLSDPTSDLHTWFQANVMEPARRDGLNVNMPLDQQDLEALMHRAVGGFNSQVDINKRFDDIAPKGSTPDMRKGARDVVDLFQFLYVLDDEIPIYAERRQALDIVRQDQSADPFERLRAYGQYYDDLGSLITTVGPQNPVMTSALNAERRYLMGDTSGGAALVSEDALLAPFGSIGSPSEGATFAAEVAQLRDVTEKLVTGEYVATIDPLTKAWSAVHITEARQAFGGGYVLVPQEGQSVTFTPGASPEDRLLGRGTVTPGQRITYGVAYGTKPITAVAPSAAADPDTGEFLDDALTAYRSTNLGQVAYIPNAAGGNTAIYGIYVGGRLRWTTESPFTGSYQTQTDPQSGGMTLVVNPVQTPNALAGIDPATGRPTPGVPPTDPTSPVVFNPRSIIDESVVGADSVFAFADPSLAFLASTPANRSRVAGMDAQSMITLLQSSPWIDWNDRNQVTEVISDIGAIKSASSTSADRGAGAEFEFYRELRHVRMPGDPNAFFSSPDPTQFAAEMFLTRGVRVPGLDFNQKQFTYVPGRGLEGGWSVNDLVNKARQNAMPYSGAGYPGGRPMQRPPAQAAGQPPEGRPEAQPFLGGFVPGTRTGAAAAQAQPGAMPWGSRSYGAPTVQAAGQVRLPNMPGTTPTPWLVPTAGALTPPPTAPAPVITPTTPFPTPPTRPPIYQPKYPAPLPGAPKPAGNRPQPY